jgi:hypothetical protein
MLFNQLFQREKLVIFSRKTCILKNLKNPKKSGVFLGGFFGGYFNAKPIFL